MLDKKTFLTGLTLVLIGVWLSLRNFGIIDLSFEHLYPIALLLCAGGLFYSVKKRGESAALFPATIFLTLGAFFLLRNYDFLSWKYNYYNISEYWPIFPLAFGIAYFSKYLQNKTDRSLLIPAVTLSTLGLVFMLQSVKLFLCDNFLDLWPLSLVLAGLIIILTSLRSKRS